MTTDGKFELTATPVHLGLGAKAVQEPVFGGMQWYADYAQRHSSDGAEGRLVSMYTFSEPWNVWEMHPKGDELVVCTAGTLTLHQELPDGVKQVTLKAGEAVINPAGVWHTADVQGQATALFVTAGLGTEHRPR